MFVSVVITVRNEEKYISQLLDSLLVQEKPYEIIIVDAYSTDKTRKIVKEYIRKYKFIKLYERKGLRGEGLNYGVSKAKGRYIAFADGDDIVNPFWLKEIKKSFKDGADVVVGKTVSIGYGPWEELERVKLFYHGVDVSVPGCNIACKRDLFLRIGGYDPLILKSEDIDLNIRAVDAGARFVYNPKAIVYHRTRDSFRAFAKQAFWYGYGRAQLVLKYGNLWKYYSASNFFKQMSFWGSIRLFFGALGYLTCKLSCKNVFKKKIK